MKNKNQKQVQKSFEKQTPKPVHEVGKRVKMTEEQMLKVKQTEQDLSNLEHSLGKARAVYVAAEQDYIQKRLGLENLRLATVKEAAALLGVPTEGDQQWEFYPDSGEFERKK